MLPVILESALKLTPTDAERYTACKQVLKDGVAVCFIVGAAAREIKEKGWFRADGFKTWEAFCEKEFGWTHHYLNQLIVDSKVINALPESMRKFITSHRAASELAKIPETLRPAVVEAAVAGGKKATAAAIKKSSPPPRPAAKKSSPPPRKSTPPARKKPAPKVIKDETGLPIPVEILEAYEAAGRKAGDLLMYIRGIMVTLKKAQEDNDLVFVELDFQDDLAKLVQVHTDLRRAKPYAVCSSCQGKLSAECQTCKGRGYLSEFAWNTFVPEEHRKLREAAK
jgi:hypothetical protein